MGEHTIRELMRRRSGSTQRALQRRRELAQGIKHSPVPKILGLLVLFAIVGMVGYVAYLMQQANGRFVTDKAIQSSSTTLTLANTTAFLPNTLLAAQDPDFYSKNGLSGSLLTRRLVLIDFPGSPYAAKWV